MPFCWKCAQSASLASCSVLGQAICSLFGNSSSDHAPCHCQKQSLPEFIVAAIQIVSGIRPTLQQGWQATNQYTSGAQAQASDFYAKSRDYTSKTWSTYQPHVNRLSSDWKVCGFQILLVIWLMCERASAAMYI